MAAPPPRSRRGGVSAAPLAPSNEPYERVVIAKSEDAKNTIRDRIKDNIMFNHLDKEQEEELIDAMFEKNFKAGEVIIKQGDDGDNFFIVADGQYECWIATPGQEDKCVYKGKAGDCFGELALIYNQPRAATVKATTDLHVFGLDQNSYRRILMATTEKKRGTYEDFLSQIPILESLNKYERFTIADALADREAVDGEVLVKEGDEGDHFFIIIEGNCQVTQNAGADGEKVVGNLKPGDYFGEIALLTNRPRAATVKSVGKTKLAWLTRRAFDRVLGPCEDILKRNMENYKSYLEQKHIEKVDPSAAEEDDQDDDAP
eukprot:TRINITY_DN640_c0_g1_i2.p1 TRINITY_DN640_c0_g1~~TRINITY_DN640_c0_g1_i2.p1  ORF type:complete len:317 (-),score=109.49 TRINITY_DN640_c0_g1_i2:558-1508(-)